ncbi:MAG: hypothetical protein AAFQ87_10050 [Bacteroidota bacterium]
MTSKTYFSNLTILFYAMAGGQVIFAAVAFFLQSNGSMPQDDSLGNLMLMIVGALIISTQVGSRFVIGKRMQDVRKMPLVQKTEQYRGVFIMRLALMEGPSLLAIVGYLITGNIWLLVIGMAMLLFFLTYFPSPTKVSNELELESSERNILENPEATIQNV